MGILLKSKINYFIIIFLISLLDKVSKIYIEFNINKLINKDLFIITIEFVKNNGAAFNIFSGNRIFLSFISIISSIILSYFIFVVDNNIYSKYGLSFILGGSIGNGIDRIKNGYVIDFINFKFIDFPIFNIADIVINIGVFILIISYFRYKKKFDE